MVDAAQLAQFQEREGTEIHVALWVTGRDRATGAAESLGFWTGDDTEVLTVGGEARTYFGAGAVIEVPPIRASVGLAVRYHTITLPPFLPEVLTALRQYNPKGARAELHALPFDIHTGRLLGSPVRLIKGRIEAAPENLEPGPGQSRVELTIASSARALTRTLPRYRSQAALSARAPGDLGREYIDTAAEVTVPWAEK